MRLEEILTDEQIQKIYDVVNSDDWSFNALVAASGLSPKRDFRHVDLSDMDLRAADLRGFDFTGADLRGCIRDSQTLIDETTILEQAEVDWITEEKVPIIEKMFEVENARGEIETRKQLEELTSQYSSTRHTHLYLRNLLTKTQSSETFFALLDFFEPISPTDKEIVAEGLMKFALKAVRRPSKKGSSLTTTGYARFFDRLQSSSNKFVEMLLTDFLEGNSHKGRISLNPNKYEVGADVELLLEVIESAKFDTSEKPDLVSRPSSRR